MGSRLPVRSVLDKHEGGSYGLGNIGNKPNYNFS